MKWINTRLQIKYIYPNDTQMGPLSSSHKDTGEGPPGPMTVDTCETMSVPFIRDDQAFEQP